ncbi:DEAD/DEAH box helicase, partial [Variovorax sp. J22R203]|uniref:DEAD/DEAH box helicase n=1 Tax=Variovorax sp. J22R203 TaxID=3053512 RepID=UPI00257556A7
ADWPAWADADLVRGYRALGVERPWEHQVEAADAAWAGRHTVLATSTGSGKSLAFWLPALSAVRRGAAGALLDPGRIESVTRRPTVLYLSPTKALAADQLAGLERLLAAAGTRDVRVATCDGDTSRDERRWVREHADVVLTNPDFLHFALLPAHPSWSRLLSSLAYVVVDECHAFRGVFGAHVALVLRRLRRLAGASGASPTFVLASATTSDPAASAARMLGVAADDVHAVTVDTSPAGRKTVVLWQPPELPGDGGPWAALLPAEDPWATVVPLPPGDGSAPDLPPAPGPEDADGEQAREAGEGTAGEATTRDDDVPEGDGGPPGRRPDGPRTAPEGSGPVGTGERLVALPRDRPRRTATAEVADLLADLVAAGARV